MKPLLWRLGIEATRVYHLIWIETWSAVFAYAGSSKLSKMSHTLPINGLSLGFWDRHAIIKSTTAWGASSGTLMSTGWASRVGCLSVQICNTPKHVSRCYWLSWSSSTVIDGQHNRFLTSRIGLQVAFWGPRLLNVNFDKTGIDTQMLCPFSAFDQGCSWVICKNGSLEQSKHLKQNWSHSGHTCV